MWTPGRPNPADPLNRADLPPSDGDLLRRRSGRDRYSRLRLPELIALVPPDAAAGVEEAFGEATYRAACLRWVLRGLSCEAAIRKIDIGRSRRQARGRVGG